MRKIFLMTAIVATFLMVIGLARVQAQTFLVNDATGGGLGGCSKIGVWDDLTATCTMTGDTTEQIVIQASGNGLTLDCDGSTIDPGPVGISAGFADTIKVKNCTVIASSIGIIFGNVTNSIVRDNTIAGLILLSFSSSNTIRGNTLNNGNGILLQVSDNNTIRDNVLGGSSTAISVTSDSVDNVVRGNTVSNIDRIGIFVGTGADRTIVVQNVVDGTNSIGILVDNVNDGVQVLKNNVMNVGSFGISVPNGLNTLVEGNVINGALAGISLGGAAVGAIVNKNSIRNTTSGIFVFGINHTFKANDVNGASNFGLSISGAATGLVFEKGNKFCNSEGFDIHDGGTDQTWGKTTCDTIAGDGNATCTKMCK